MSEEELLKIAESFHDHYGQNVRTEEDVVNLTRLLSKITVERALKAELDYHLDEASSNSRNGYTTKGLQTESGKFSIQNPRDRNGTFEPVLVKKGQRRFTSFDDRILTFYSKGMSTRDIVDAFKDIYNADISPALISKVTEAVQDEIHEWQNRVLDRIYPIVYLDCIVTKVQQDKRVINKSIYVALGITSEGTKAVLGLWISENEGSKFWLSVLTELQARGLQEVCVFCVDGLKGFPDAIQSVYPKSKVQLCIVHLVRNSLRYVPHKDKKAVASDLKLIYQSVSAEEALGELDKFSTKWDGLYGSVSKKWYDNWDNITTLFEFPKDVRKIIYTTNAIESLNSVIRKNINNKRVFPNDSAALKMIYLSIRQATEKWTMPIHDWRPAMNAFNIIYGLDL